MKYSAAALASTFAGIALVNKAQGFSPTTAFARTAIRATSAPSSVSVRSPYPVSREGAPCVREVASSCPCSDCARLSTKLFAEGDDETDEIEDETPAEVVAMDGVESADEAHNVDRPARNSLKKKRPQSGKPLSEFNEGDTIKASVKSVTDYGCFCDFGAVSDGLVHISRMSKEFVKDVKEIVSVGDEVEVRIVEINLEKGQIALSFLSEDEEEQATQNQRRGPRQNQQRQARRDDSAILNKVVEKGYDPEVFVPGKVVSAVAFGAFVRINAKTINEELEGEFDGLVHISSLAKGRTSSVTDVVNVDDNVQVRIKNIGDGKVALSMMTVEDEAEQQERGGGGGGGYVDMGAKDWKESLEKLQSSMPEFKNGPMLVERK